MDNDEFKRFFKPKKKGGGKNEVKDCRNQVLHVYLTQAEKKQLEKEAMVRNMRLSEYLRNVSLYPCTPALRLDVKSFHGLSREIKRIGVNLNQLAKHYNTHGLSDKNVATLLAFHANIEKALLVIMKKSWDN